MVPFSLSFTALIAVYFQIIDAKIHESPGTADTKPSYQRAYKHPGHGAVKGQSSG